MEDNKRGKQLVIAIICVILGIDIITNIINWIEFGELEVEGIIRFILTCLVLYFFYKGYNWIRITMGILLIISSIFGLIKLLPTGMVLIFTHPFIAIYLISMPILMGITGVLLFASKKILSFLQSQKDSRLGIGRDYY